MNLKYKHLFHRPDLRPLFLCALIILMAACNSGKGNESRLISDSLREKELNDKEQRLKESELQLKEKTDAQQRDAQKPTLSQYYEKEKDAVWMIFASNEEQTAQGSGFVINESGVAISNHHVFENATNYIAVNSKGEKFGIDKIYTSDPSTDYAIFHIQGAGQPFTYVPIAEAVPQIGEDCFAIGNPQGLSLTLSKGIISGIRNNGATIQTTAEITHGSSGGPLFNSKGEVIGITSSGYETADLNFAVNIHKVPYAAYLHPDNTTVRVAVDYPEPGQAAGPARGTGEAPSLARAQKVLADYFEYSRRRDYRSMVGCLAPVINTFYSSSNISREDAVRSSAEYDIRKGIRVVSNEIQWNAAERKMLPDGYLFKFRMDYTITSTDPKLPHHMDILVTAGLNEAAQINFLKEKILSRN